jgi:hypothetical protein
VDGLNLLLEAGAAGLTVMADGDRLVIRGPKSADTVARRLLARKAVVLAALSAGNGNTTPVNPEKHSGSVDSSCPWDEATEPGPACPVCGSLESWQDALGRERCGVCEADALAKALQLAERAARLRKRAQSRKPAPRIASCCVVGGVSIHKTSTASGPHKGNQRASWAETG